jgi:GNAT superfamily N-acetyltransferase
MKIIPYEDKYIDDMIFMVLSAKDALGRKPTINEDLLDVKKNYLDKGDMFWIALDDSDRVIGCIGHSGTERANEAFLHRLYVKPSLKHQGIGTALLKTAESAMKENGITASLVHLGEPKEQWFESYSFYPKHGYLEYEPRYMKKSLI